MAEQRSGVARTTISSPPEVKRQMDNVEESVNWSAVATQAFEQKLGELAAQKKEKSLTDVIQRLRVSKSKYDEEFYRAGSDAGSKWAKDDATWVELRELGESFSHSRWEDWVARVTKGDSVAAREAEVVAHALAVAIYGNEGAEHFDQHVFSGTPFAEWFWEERVIGPDEPRWRNLDFLQGFAEGAARIYAEIRDKV